MRFCVATIQSQLLTRSNEGEEVMARDQIWDDLKAISKAKFDADRAKALADALSPDNNDGGWTEHTPYHWSRMAQGHKLDYWPSRKKWQYRGKVRRGLVGMYKILGEQNENET